MSNILDVGGKILRQVDGGFLLILLPLERQVTHDSHGLTNSHTVIIPLVSTVYNRQHQGYGTTPKPVLFELKNHLHDGLYP